MFGGFVLIVFGVCLIDWWFVVRSLLVLGFTCRVTDFS